MLQHWSAPPGVLVPVAVAAVLHWRGQLAVRARASTAGPGGRARARHRAVRAGIFYAGLASVVVALASPVDYWADVYFWVHMVQHLILIYVAAPLIVMGAPWMVLARGLPASVRLPLLRFFWQRPAGRVLRRAGRAALHPAVAGVAFVTVFAGWHIPALYDMTLTHQAVHDSEHACLLVIGVWLWSQLLPSYPFALRHPPLQRVALIVGVMLPNWFLSIGMAFAGRPWYPAYASVAGRHLPLLADQELAAAFMWVVPMIPFGIVTGLCVAEWMRRDQDDDGRLRELVALTRQRMYGEVELG